MRKANNVFDYARDRIRRKYDSMHAYSCSDIKLLKEDELRHIDYCEEISKKSIKNSIIYHVDAFWSVQTDDEKLFIGSGIAVALFILFVFLHVIKEIPLNILILNLAESFFFCFVVLGAIFLYRLIRKRIVKRKNFYIIWALFFILSLPHIPVLLGYETTQIGDFYEAREYVEKYYVLMSREPETATDRKCYTLPAEVERRYDYEGTTEVYEDYYSQEHGGKDVYSLNYHINYLYFPNGGYLSFDYDYAYSEPSCTTLRINQESEVTDYQGNEYYVTLTKRKAN